MKLFLASSIDKTLNLLLNKLNYSLSGKKVLFIENASDNEEGDKWWITLDREAFEKAGAKAITLDLRENNKEAFKEKINEVDIIHFCGGSVLYLMSLIRKQDLQQVIVDAVKNNDVLYTGTSAGSMIAARDLSLSKYDPDEEGFVEDVEDFSGLGLVDFLVIPHAGNKDFIESDIKMVEKLPEYNQTLMFLYDNQAIWVEGEGIKLLSS
jgi:dipeptidase E